MGKVLVVVDYQKDFVDGALGFAGAKELEAGLLALVEEYIQNNWPVVFTLDTHGPDYLSTREGKHLPLPHCRNEDEIKMGATDATILGAALLAGTGIGLPAGVVVMAIGSTGAIMGGTVL